MAASDRDPAVIRGPRGHGLRNRDARRPQPQLPDKPLHIRIERPGTHRHRLPIAQFPQILRQLIRARQRGPIQQHRHNRNIPSQRLADLDAHEIAFVIQSPPVGFRVARIDPSGTDQREQHLTLIDPPFEDISEVQPPVGTESTSMNTFPPRLARERGMDRAGLIFGVSARDS